MKNQCINRLKFNGNQWELMEINENQFNFRGGTIFNLKKNVIRFQKKNVLKRGASLLCNENQSHLMFFTNFRIVYASGVRDALSDGYDRDLRASLKNGSGLMFCLSTF